jgi:hypothetical protein
MDATTIVNKNGLFRILLSKYSSTITYIKLTDALSGEPGSISKEEASAMRDALDDAVKVIKVNINLSIQK